MSPSPNGPRSRFLRSRSRTAALTALSVVVALSTSWVGGGSAAAAAADEIIICHASNSNVHPYGVQSPSKSGDVGGHAADNGPVWDPGLKAAGIQWGDIIPPFTYTDNGVVKNFPGLNWGTWGQAIWNNGCGLPTTVAAVTPTVAPSTCVAGVLTSSRYTVPSTPGVVYSVNGVVTAGGTVRSGVAPAFDTLTAVASSAAFFLTNAPFSVQLDFLPNAAGCTGVTAVAPTVQPSVCAAGVVTPSYYDVPTTAASGIIWKVGATDVSGTRRSGSAPASETLTAEAAPGFVLTNAPFSVPMDFLADAAGCTPALAVNAGAVTASSCVANAAVPSSWVVPTTAGVQYKVNGNNVTSGTVRTGSAPTVETLTAVALPGFTLTNPGFSQTISFGALATGCAPVIIPVTPTSPDLSIVKAGPTSAVKPGDNVSYTLTVTNIGTGGASNVQVSDVLPAALSFVSASGTGFTCSGTSSISCQLAGTLAPGASAVVNVVATLSSSYASTSIANTATVLPTDANPANNTSTDSTDVTLPTPPVDEDLGLSKTGLQGSVAPGGVLSWTLNVTNVKGTPAAGFTVVDVVPAGLTVMTVGGTDWGCTTTGQTVSCTYTGAPLVVGSSAAFQIDAVVAADYAGTEVSNTAVVDPGGVDATNDSATSVTPVTEVITGGGGGGVTEPTPAEPAAGGGGPVLPFTGTNADQMLSWGVTVLMFGLLLAIAGRRRRSA